jgi:hypothetical protein
MPTSHEILWGVLGGVLLLVAVGVPRFKIFGAEVSGTMDAVGRVTASILGLYFIGLS